jgi:hypothetical protein
MSHPLPSTFAAAAAAASATPSRRQALRLGLALLGGAAAGLGSPSAQAGFARAAAAPAGETQVYAGVKDGVPGTLTLRRRGDRFEGEFEESGARAAVRGQVGPDRSGSGGLVWEGTLDVPGLPGVALPLQARGDGRSLMVSVTVLPGMPAVAMVMQRQDGAAATPVAAGSATSTTPGSGRIEPALVGRWVHDRMLSSSGGAGGFAALSTRRVMLLRGDGRAEMTEVSAVGGGGWSAGRSESLVFQGRWELRGEELWAAADGDGVFRPMARVRLVDGRLVATTAQGRQIWTR